MDNASGGVRGLRATVSRELLDAVTDAYGIGTVSEAADLGGSSNLNLLVHADVGRLVVRAHRPCVTEDRLRDIQTVRRELSEAGVPCGGLVPTRDGRPWISFDSRLVEVERCVDHDGYMRSWERLDEGMHVLGRMHSVMRHVAVSDAGESPPFANYVSPRDAFGQTLRGVRRIRRWNTTPSEVQLAIHAEELARLVSGAEQAFIEASPAQLVHGDFWDNNVFFRGDRLVFVADFDYMGERPRIDDLALTLFFTCMEFFEQPVSDDQLRRLRRLLEAYDKDSDTPLTAAERAALPVAIARQPLWSIGGWVLWLDDDETARKHVAGSSQEIDWALGLMREVARWQAALA